ncbi:hypothetical protein N7493_004045 [Penicillium malachiteum]|uniref:Uncharacterized protein n=1 Tax=Penicillium malachiteum TaxID=1324776 RepID=A0AAD6HQW4_9EURO|nr:hypothetical protein N7493_004045 [Penicillium malachiteum]
MAEPETESSVAGYGEDKERFLEALPPPTKRYIYDSQKLDKILDFERSMQFDKLKNLNPSLSHSDYIIFLISPSSFGHEFEAGYESHRIKYFYNMPTPLHVKIAQVIDDEIKKELRSMVLDKNSLHGLTRP